MRAMDAESGWEGGASASLRIQAGVLRSARLLFPSSSGGGYACLCLLETVLCDAKYGGEGLGRGVPTLSFFLAEAEPHLSLENTV